MTSVDKLILGIEIVLIVLFSIYASTRTPEQKENKCECACRTTEE